MAPGGPGHRTSPGRSRRGAASRTGPRVLDHAEGAAGLGRPTLPLGHEPNRLRSPPQLLSDESPFEPRLADAGLSGQTEQLRPVAPEEPFPGRLVEARDGIAERLEGPLSPFGMRVVRGEHEELRAALLQQPCRVLEREGREAHLAAEVLRGQEAEFAQRRLELRERAERVIDIAEEARHPGRAELDGRSTQSREALEDPVERHAGEEALRRMVKDRKVLGPQVLTAAEPILGAGSSVVVERLGKELPAPDVEDERHPGLGETGPHGVEVDMGG